MANFNALNTVTANPTETATEELQKLKVGNTVYSVEGGGGVVTIDIMQTGASGTLTAKQVALIVDNFPNVNIRWLGQDIFMPLEYTTDNYKFAKVQTSDTQAETKLIIINAPTNTWTFTQYLANLGGGGSSGGGLTKTKVTLAELQNELTNINNVGAIVQVHFKGDYSVYYEMALTLNSQILNLDNACILSASAASTIGTTGTENELKTLTLGMLISSEGVILSGLYENSFKLSDTNITQQITNLIVDDDHFDFYIYK